MFLLSSNFPKSKYFALSFVIRNESCLKYFFFLQNPSSYKTSSEIMQLEAIVKFGTLLHIGLILQCAAHLHRRLHHFTRKAKTVKDKLIFNAISFITTEVYKYVIQHNIT